MAELESWIAMNLAPHASRPLSLYELAWTYAPGSMFAVDCDTGKLINSNPAAVALSGYSHDELIGMSLADLHPESERERVKVEFLKAVQEPSQHPGFHIQRKDGRCAPVAISLSKSAVLDGRSVLVCVYFDITDQQEKEHQLSTQNWALGAYAIAALALGRVRSSEKLLLHAICEAITHKSTYIFAWIGIAEDGPGKKIRIAAKAGSAVGYLDGLHLSWAEEDPNGQGPTGVCIRTGTMQILEDAQTSPIFGPWRERARQFGIRSSVSIPLRIKGSWHGALVVYSARPKAFEAAPVEVFERLGEHVVHGIQAIKQKQLLDAERRHLEKTQKHLTDALAASVSAMVTAMEIRDPYTAGHEVRVAQIAYAIGQEMGWPEDRLQGLRMAAMVHDIGKISIPSEILTKPARLNPVEFALVKRHPESSYIILKDIPYTWPIADIVRQHHEKLDGSGYPLGLKGDAILPEAKVLAVADIVEAMAAARPYRAALGLEVALAQIEKEAGTLLDAEVVRICAALFREKRLVLPGLS
jgi:PAS domain S-box-containing protein